LRYTNKLTGTKDRSGHGAIVNKQNSCKRHYGPLQLNVNNILIDNGSLPTRGRSKLIYIAHYDHLLLGSIPRADCSISRRKWRLVNLRLGNIGRHLLGKLSINLIRDIHDAEKHRIVIQVTEVVMQHLEDTHLQ
jgi:hypothetical protein